MSGLRVYLSYDLAHDRDLHDRLSQQARKPASFTIAARSEGGEIDSAWSERVRKGVAEADEVIVLCGEHTDESMHVSAELKIAQEQHKPYVLLWGRRDSGDLASSRLNLSSRTSTPSLACGSRCFPYSESS